MNDKISYGILYDEMLFSHKKSFSESKYCHAVTWCEVRRKYLMVYGEYDSNVEYMYFVLKKGF